MEFERALFRIHQRTLEADAVKNLRLNAEKFMPGVIFVLALSLALLHMDYVGKARCLPGALQHAGLWNATADAPALPEDALLGLTVVEGDELLDLRISMPAEPEPGSAADAGDAAAGNGTAGIAVQEALQGTIASYRFAFDRELVMLKASTLKSHHFKSYNVSVSERCLAPSRALGDAFRFFDGYDGLVVNELAYTFRSRGFLERTEGGVEVESWAWSLDQVESASPKGGRGLLASAARKVSILSKSCITVFLISALTGFFIRVAVNGSAVLMFPMALVARAIGANAGRLSIGVLIRSFPWIGVHVEVLRRANQPLWPLFRSHLIFLFVQSFAYLSCNLAWRFVLYRKSSPEGFEERIFSFCSVLELFNLIFVRSAETATVFPKLSVACLVWLHFYVFCCLYPFHSLALSLCMASCCYVMVYCLNHFEEPALRGDNFDHTTPTTVHPRALYMPQLSPSWTLESAPLWTMFYPPEPPSEFPPEAMRYISNEEYLMP